jgi:hypothetical protein
MEYINGLKEMENCINEAIKEAKETIIFGTPTPIIQNKIININFCYNKLKCVYKNNPVKFDHCIFKECNFNGIEFKRKSFNFCEFRDCNFTSTDMQYCKFSYCIFIHSEFNRSKIYDSYIHFCSFGPIGVGFSDFEGTRIYHSDIVGSHCTNLNIPQIVPATGSFIGYKRAKRTEYEDIDKSSVIVNFKPVIVKLLIPEDAKRISSTSRKCRCNKAKVLDIYDYEEDDIMERIKISEGYWKKEVKVPQDKLPEYIKNHYEDAYSYQDPTFDYKVGEIIEVKDFDEECNECSIGIHFFTSEKEALEFCMF